MQEMGHWHTIAVFIVGVANSVVIGLFDQKQMKESLTAVCRALVQLVILGVVLEKLFDMDTQFSKLLALVLICFAGGFILNRRLKGDLKGLVILYNILLLSTVPAIVIGYLLFDDEFFGASGVLIPFSGLLVGNVLNGLQLGISHFHESIKKTRSQIEFKLALGAPGPVAFRASIQAAMRQGLIPVLSSLFMVGVVSIPGFMAGQMMAGTAPLVSARYQFFLLISIQTTVIAGMCSYFLLQMLLVKENDYVLELLEK